MAPFTDKSLFDVDKTNLNLFKTQPVRTPSVSLTHTNTFERLLSASVHKQVLAYRISHSVV